MPVVMLLNLGSIGGPTDGTSALSRKIDAIVGPDHPGVVFVTGTGDDGIPSNTQTRAAGDVPNGGTRDLRFALDTGGGRLEVWYDQRQGFAVWIDTPMGMLGPYPPSQFYAEGTGVRVYHDRGDDFYEAANDKRLLLIDFDGAAGAGDYFLRLDHVASSTGSSIHFDASLNTLYGAEGRFLNFVTPGGSIWDGATAFHNVAPNSYVIRTKWTNLDGVDQELTGEGNVGELWAGSSVGPTVDGRVGVDISAPGDRIVTAYAPRSDWATYPHLLIEDGGGLYGMAGAVSAAAPIVTGIITLMLEVNPTLDALSVKKILQETARADEFTGPTPNPLWGYGKVDAFEALMAVRDRPAANRAPAASGTLPDRALTLPGTLTVDVSPTFVDPDGDRLTYAVSSSAPDVVTVLAPGARVTLTAVGVGRATIEVTATDPGDLSATQAFTVTVVVTVSGGFTDDPIVAGVTPVRAVHFTELRTHIDALREEAGLGRSRWTDPVLRAGVTPVRLVHLLELREALRAAYTAAGPSAPRWTDAAPTAGTTQIRAAHLTELRGSATESAVLTVLPELLSGTYLLAVTWTEGVGATFYLTVGAVGPAGPQGLQGPQGGSAVFLSSALDSPSTAAAGEAAAADDGGTFTPQDHTDSSTNTHLGAPALESVTTGTGNTAVGQQTLRSLTTGLQNAGFGWQTLRSLTPGRSNLAIGTASMVRVTDGSFNTAIGSDTLKATESGEDNVAIGTGALLFSLGNQNVGIGRSALRRNTEGSGNIAIGYGAGNRSITGSNNVYIGNAGVRDEEGTIRIGTEGVHNRIYLAGEIVGGGVAAVYQ